ncbi:Putative Thioesterase domain, HotDog domain superfamily [Septoria linicola]|uniref:Thioesterase domain, HotDog domain superfamily n=1 Tax=Septoria linicola TaxID=215465 RepID=A0A9Q9ALX0_9PEZI|nr:putative Thioesterase domain, HotDog domain superfamily [Septoria linicola]USW51724.1 Putative Thioesterase domain, HotDog domain superfamily [Septoria linicola]
MAFDDTIAPFRRIPWTTRLLNQPDIVTCVPTSRQPKASTEDSFYAEILKTPRTIRSCIAIYRKPAREEDPIEEVTTLYKVGDGMNGHPEIIHGGVTATLIDESMGILQSINKDRIHMRNVQAGKADGEIPPEGLSAFTAYLNVKYLKPVRTPGAIAVVAKRVKKEGRKEFLFAELKQCHDAGEDDEGEIVVCASGESLFVTPKNQPGSKL